MLFEWPFRATPRVINQIFLWSINLKWGALRRQVAFVAILHQPPLYWWWINSTLRGAFTPSREFASTSGESVNLIYYVRVSNLSLLAWNLLLFIRPPLTGSSNNQLAHSSVDNNSFVLINT